MEPMKHDPQVLTKNSLLELGFKGFWRMGELEDEERRRFLFRSAGLDKVLPRMESWLRASLWSCLAAPSPSESET
jgi:hypothetical protein